MVVRTPDGLETPMVIGKPAPFVSAFVEAVDDAIRAHQPQPRDVRHAAGLAGVLCHRRSGDQLHLLGPL